MKYATINGNNTYCIRNESRGKETSELLLLRLLTPDVVAPVVLLVDGTNAHAERHILLAELWETL